MSQIYSPGAAILMLLFCFVAPGCGDAAAEQDDRDAFDAYQAAKNAHNVDGMIALIDPENLKHDDYLVQVARAGSKGDIMRLSAYDRLQVTMLRAAFKADELKNLNGRKLLAVSVEQDWDEVGEADEQVSLGDVTIKPPRALGEVEVDGERTGLKLEFVNVDHKWVLNKDCLDGVPNRLIQRIAQLARMSEDDVVLRFASRLLGREVRKSIWDEPPK